MKGRSRPNKTMEDSLFLQCFSAISMIRFQPGVSQMARLACMNLRLAVFMLPKASQVPESVKSCEELCRTTGRQLHTRTTSNPPYFNILSRSWQNIHTSRMIWCSRAPTFFGFFRKKKVLRLIWGCAPGPRHQPGCDTRDGCDKERIGGRPNRVVVLLFPSSRFVFHLLKVSLF